MSALCQKRTSHRVVTSSRVTRVASHIGLLVVRRSNRYNRPNLTCAQVSAVSAVSAARLENRMGFASQRTTGFPPVGPLGCFSSRSIRRVRGEQGRLCLTLCLLDWDRHPPQSGADGKAVDAV